MKILLIVGGFFAAVCLIGFFLPTAYAVERKVTINATPEQVHALVGDLKAWPQWAPWEEDDPTIKTTYGEKTTGVGASQSWTGKDGDGELTLTASSPTTGIAYDMAFIQGDMRAPAECAMSYQVADGTTTVTWSMKGDLASMMPPVLSGYMNLTMPSMIGGMFDRGLEKLKGIAESGTPAPAEVPAEQQ